MSKPTSLENALQNYVEIDPEIPEPLIYRVQVSCETTGEDIYDEEVSAYAFDGRLDEVVAIVERHQELVTGQVL